ncbi:MAG: DUF983 domain-containing protein [Pseudomonadota bacterium]
MWQAMRDGALWRCPACQKGRMFERYLKVADSCDTCGTELHHHRADDAPPYFTIFVVGHIALAGVLAIEKAWKPEVWVQLVIWLPFTMIASLILLPVIKGAFVGLQWALRMHGFGGEPDAAPVPGDLGAASRARGATRADPR